MHSTFRNFAAQNHTKMKTKNVNEALLRNAAILSKHSKREDEMMPGVDAQLPQVEEVKEIVRLAKSIIFTDYFYRRQPEEQIRQYYIGVALEELYGLLKNQITRGLQFCTPEPQADGQPREADCSEKVLKQKAAELALQLINRLPEIKRLLYTDVEAMFQNDPAATNFGEVIYCYPVINTMTHYRLAHELHKMEVPVIPRIITELAHSKTGIDIHPGATIGEHFAIDHGTGVVIGETCIIGNHVTLYQGVTLGAKSFKYDAEGNMLNIPRHPIIEDYVTIYSNASILGRITIGHHSVIGGNIWVTHDVMPYSRLQQSKAVDTAFEGGLGI